MNINENFKSQSHCFGLIGLRVSKEQIKKFAIIANVEEQL